MQQMIKKYLNRSFPLFLSCREGRIYFSLLLPILTFALISLQPLGLNNWHECHKTMVLFFYCTVYLSTYAATYYISKSICPRYFTPEGWTIGRQFKLLAVFFPLAAITTLVFIQLYVEEFQLSIQSVIDLQCYNLLMGLYIIVFFGYFVSLKLKPIIHLPTEKQPNQTLPSDNIIIKNKTIHPANVLWVECSHNNLNINTWENDQINTFTIRHSMQRFEQMVTCHCHLVRCHQSFMVNIGRVEGWQGNSEEKVLHLLDGKHTIRVSGSYMKKVDEHIEKKQIPKISKSSTGTTENGK